MENQTSNEVNEVVDNAVITKPQEPVKKPLRAAVVKEADSSHVSVSKSELYKIVFCLLTNKIEGLRGANVLRVIGALFNLDPIQSKVKLEEIKQYIIYERK